MMAIGFASNAADHVQLLRECQGRRMLLNAALTVCENPWRWAVVAPDDGICSSGKAGVNPVMMKPAWQWAAVMPGDGVCPPG